VRLDGRALLIGPLTNALRGVFVQAVLEDPGAAAS